MTADQTLFQRDLSRVRPSLTGVLSHRNFAAADKFLKTFCGNVSGGNIIAIIGPSNSGKTLLLHRLATHLREVVFKDAAPDAIPILGAFVMPSNDTRVTPKYVIQMLLSDAGHPLYDPVKLSLSGYRGSSSNNTETDHLKRLRNLFSISRVEFVMLDDAQSIARTNNKDFGAMLLEALKVLSGPGQNLVFTGGYELLGPLLAYRSHLAARVTIVHLSPYQGKEDYGAWQGIIKTIEKQNSHGLGENGALRTCSEELYVQCHGCFGLLEKHLQQVIAYAASCGSSITAEMIRSVKPMQAQWTTINTDIVLGKEALAQVPDVIDVITPGVRSEATSECTTASKGAESATKRSDQLRRKQPAGGRPFRRRPARVPGA